jgi:hypothetical protein
MIGDRDDLEPSDFECRKSSLLVRIQEKLAKAEDRHAVLVAALARRTEVVTSTKADVGAAEAAYQRQLEEARATKAVLQTLERQFHDLENSEPELP